jgi:hypothetical protein
MATLGFSTLLPQRCWEYQKYTDFVYQLHLMFSTICTKEQYSESLEYLNNATKVLIGRNRCNYDYFTNIKAHTIREDKNNAWKAGRKVHAVVFNRSKYRTQFIPTFECTGTQTIAIYPKNNGLLENRVIVDGRELSHDEIIKLSRYDGFKNSFAFCKYFNKPFEGKLIHFTDLRY